MKHTSKIKAISLSGLLCAVIFIFTTFIKLPVHTGYVHCGDGFIYLTAALLPFPYAAFAGGVGAMLADCLGGFPMWAPATLVIKILSVLCFTSKHTAILCRRNIAAVILSSVISIGGYYLYEVILTANVYSPLLGVGGNAMQSIISIAEFFLIGLFFDKMKIKKYTTL